MCLRTKWQWQAFQITVRMAEWSKAPDSRIWSFHKGCGWGLSGPRMWAWVRIPLLTHLFLFSSVYVYVSFKKKKDIATAGNRTPINCLEGNYANHYTTVAVEFSLSGIQCLDFFKNRPSSHLHTAVIPSTQTNLSLVAITKLFESDLEKQKEYETHLCLSRQKDKKEIDGLRNSSQALSFYSYH